MQKNLDRLQASARVLLGLLFAVYGLNGFLNFLPPPPVNESGGAFLMALGATGYMFPLIKATEVVAGLLLIGNRATPFALLLLAPIIVNIAAFHVFIQSGAAMILAIVALEVALAYSYRKHFASLFSSVSNGLQKSPL